MSTQTTDTAEGKRILIAEDDDNIRALLASYLSVSGFDIQAVGDGAAALKHLKASDYDLAVLDIMLPGMDGLEICRRVRENRDMPVLLLTALGEEPDRIEGFQSGADDYVVKPFSPRELVARVKAILRRTEPASQAAASGEGSEGSAGTGAYPVEVDTACKTATCDGRDLALTASEFKILAALAGRKGVVYSRDELLDLLYPAGEAVVHKTVDFHVHNIRGKLGEARAGLLETVRGFGYRLKKSDV